jgi:hypothetical protein
VHIVEILAACAAALVLLAILGILARQRFMLRAPGTVPVAFRMRKPRWQYGVARFDAGELRCYRSLGLGTRPTRLIRRSDLSVLARRGPVESERGSLPPHAVVIDCRDADGAVSLAFGEGAYTGFLSWLESAPMN